MTLTNLCIHCHQESTMELIPGQLCGPQAEDTYMLKQ